MNTYHLMAVFQGECCTYGHAWFQFVRAPSRKQAAAKFKKEIERDGRELSELWEVPDTHTAEALYDNGSWNAWALKEKGGS
jgi:hypothetical protein